MDQVLVGFHISQLLRKMTKNVVVALVAIARLRGWLKIYGGSRLVFILLRQRKDHIFDDKAAAGTL